jgi:hypothetical protein
MKILLKSKAGWAGGSPGRERERTLSMGRVQDRGSINRVPERLGLLRPVLDWQLYDYRLTDLERTIRVIRGQCVSFHLPHKPPECLKEGF